VRRRCQHAERRIVDGLGRLDASGPFHDQVTAWLFPTGVTTHVLLTVRGFLPRLGEVKEAILAANPGIDD
jgi:hypothetical protein